MSLRLKLDLHVHTYHSIDCSTPIGQIIEHCKSLNLDGFAITDHDTLKGLPEALEKSEGIIVIPGIEVSAANSHILAIGVSDPIPVGLPTCETVNIIKDQGAIAIITHPYYRFTDNTNFGELRESRFNAFEVANASQFPYPLILKLNRKLATKLELPEVGGSDAHIQQDIGCSYTVIDSRSRKVEDIIKAIKGGHTEARGGSAPLKRRLGRVYEAAIWWLKNGKYSNRLLR